MADLSTIAGLPIVPGMDPGQIYTVLETLQAGIVTFGREQHRDDGKHAISTGLAADRAAATWAGMQFMAHDDDILSVSYETAPASGTFLWKEFTLNALSNSFAYGAFSASTVQEHLEFLLDLAETTKKLKAAETTYTGLATSNVVAAASDAKTAIGAIDAWAGTVGTGHAGTLQTAETNITNNASAIADHESSAVNFGAYLLGFGWTAAFNVVQNTTTDIWQALLDLDVFVTAKWNPSLGANVNVTNNGNFFSATPLTMDATASEIGDVLGNHPQEVFTQLYVDGAVAAFPTIVSRVPCPVSQADWLSGSIVSVVLDSLQVRTTAAPTGAGFEIMLYLNATATGAGNEFDMVSLPAVQVSAESAGSTVWVASTDYVRVEIDRAAGAGTPQDTMITFRWLIKRDLNI